VVGACLLKKSQPNGASVVGTDCNATNRDVIKPENMPIRALHSRVEIIQPG
jgi:hypothetical protein